MYIASPPNACAAVRTTDPSQDNMALARHDVATLSLNGKSRHEIKRDPIYFLNHGAVVTFYSDFNKALHL